MVFLGRWDVVQTEHSLPGSFYFLTCFHVIPCRLHPGKHEAVAHYQLLEKTRALLLYRFLNLSFGLFRSTFGFCRDSIYPIAPVSFLTRHAETFALLQTRWETIIMILYSIHSIQVYTSSLSRVYPHRYAIYLEMQFFAYRRYRPQST